MANLILREIVVERPTGLFYDSGASIVASQAAGGNGLVPYHKHTCLAEGDRPEHAWWCNSPYCASLNGLCPDHGGREPVRPGEEPWRGR